MSAHVIPYDVLSSAFLLSVSTVELLYHVYRTQPKNNLKQLLDNNGMRGSGNAFGAGTTRKPAFMGHARGKLNAAVLVMQILALMQQYRLFIPLQSMQRYWLCTHALDAAILVMYIHEANAATLVMHTHAVNAASAALNIVYKCFGRYMSRLNMCMHPQMILLILITP